MLSVSVIITTKNRKNFLFRAIKSVCVQSSAANEIIIVDDFSNVEHLLSTDDIQLLSEEYNIEIKYLRNTSSRGGNFSRNLGVKNSTSDIVMFLDDDDAWTKNKIRQQLLCFSERIGLVYTGKQFVNTANLEKVTRYSKENHKYKSIWSGNFIGSTSGVAIKRTVFDKVGGFDESLLSLQDFDLWIRSLAFTNCVWDSEFNLIYTIHRGKINQVSTNTDKHINSVTYLLQKYNDEISRLSLVQRRYFQSRLNHVIARSYRKNNDFRFIVYFVKSLALYPTLRTLSLIVKA